MTTEDAPRRLTAGLAEEERIARAATDPAHPGEWTAKADDNIHWIHSGGEEVAQSLGDPVQVGPHIARQDPDTTLRRVSAIRKVLRRHEEAERDSVLSERDAGFEAGLYAALEALASIYPEESTT